MSRLINPWIQFLDENGDPYEAGTVYFGLPNQDPIANPKPPYSDSLATVEIGAAQVLDKRGMFQTPLHLKGSYSMSLFDKENNFIRTDPEVTGALDGTVLSYPTVAIAKQDDDLQSFVGGYIRISEYSLGIPIDSLYEVVSGAGVDDGGSIHNSTMPNLFYLKLIHKSKSISGAIFGISKDNADNTTQLQNFFNYCSDIKHKGVLPEGEILATSLVWKSDLYISGQGFKNTVLTQIPGTNLDFIVSENFGSGNIIDIGMTDLAVNGNYFTSTWNASTGVTGNTVGYGIKFRALAATIDIVLYNIPEVGLLMEDLIGGPPSSQSDQISSISVVGQDYGKEGVIIRGPNDWELKKVFVGRAGILPRPAAETTFATSTEYGGDTVDGVVLDGVNVEIGIIHSFACWSGSGFRTRNTIRLTKGGRIISESNNNQAYITTGTFGAAYFDIRNLSLFHPNWTAATPSYSSPDPRWDGITIETDQLKAEVSCKRTITSITRVVGTTAVVVSGGSEVDMNFNNSTAPASDPEVGVLYSGDALHVSGRSAKVSADITSCNGDSVFLDGEGNRLDFAVKEGINGAAFKRDSVGNGQRGNNISGTINDCDTGFESVGTPMSERLSLSMELATGDVPFTGDLPDLGRGQIWDISASVNNVESSTRKFLQGSLNAGSTSDQTVALAHSFLYTPRVQEIQLTMDDSATPSTAYLDYLVVNSVDATNVTVGYKFGNTDGSGAANQRVNVRVG